jgi:hypothetical protein
MVMPPISNMKKLSASDKCVERLGGAACPDQQGETGHRHFFTVADLSTRWRCAEETIRRRIRRGEIKSIFIGGKHLVARAVVVSFE